MFDLLAMMSLAAVKIESSAVKDTIALLVLWLDLDLDSFDIYENGCANCTKTKLSNAKFDEKLSYEDLLIVSGQLLIRQCSLWCNSLLAKGSKN